MQIYVLNKENISPLDKLKKEVMEMQREGNQTKVVLLDYGNNKKNY